MKGLVKMKNKKVFAVTCALAAVMIAGSSAAVFAAEPETAKDNSSVSQKAEASDSSSAEKDKTELFG